ncbi:MAG TPA: ATP-binding protein, partial [Pseudonocardiaceae bacterium]|nr:ATP-binding protein [Pseudonocardiaceae bacterium]
LDLSKVEAGKMDVHHGEVALAAVAEEVERAFRPLVEEKGLRFELELDPDLAPQMTTDEGRLQQILRNLLSNAVKFTERGAVSLRIEPAPAHGQYGVPALDSAGGVVAFVVRDTGIGISDEKFAMIFEAFQQADGTTSRKYGGTGLGLSISKELARMLGGAITVSSTLGVGSTFTLFLPDELPADRAGTGLARLSSRPAGTGTGTGIGNGGPVDRPNGHADATATPSGSAAAGTGPILRQSQKSLPSLPSEPGASRAAQLHGVTVLIVDDDVRNVFALTSALELHGMTVLYADNGADGIRLLAQHPEVDIVLMDAMMPDLDGNETTRLIRALPQGESLPVVFLTAKAMPGDRESSLAAGASDYITKPVDLDELLAVMASWVSRATGDQRAGSTA